MTESEWITDRPPSEADAEDNALCWATDIELGHAYMVTAYALRATWEEGIHRPWIIAKPPTPYVPPKPEMPDRIKAYCTDGHMDGGEWYRDEGGALWSAATEYRRVVKVKLIRGELDDVWDYACPACRCQSSMLYGHRYCPECGAEIEEE